MYIPSKNTNRGTITAAPTYAEMLPPLLSMWGCVWCVKIPLAVHTIIKEQQAGSCCTRGRTHTPHTCIDANQKYGEFGLSQSQALSSLSLFSRGTNVIFSRLPYVPATSLFG